jgi:hypothetical protein
MQLNNRITGAWSDHPNEESAASEPRTQPAFVMCPIGVNVWQQQLYRAAYEQAAANLRSARMERLCRVVWN